MCGVERAKIRMYRIILHRPNSFKNEKVDLDLFSLSVTLDYPFAANFCHWEELADLIITFDRFSLCNSIFKYSDRGTCSFYDNWLLTLILANSLP